MANDIVLGSELNDEFDIGVETANKISVKVDGTSIVKGASNAGVLSAAPPVWDNVAKTITFPSQDGAAGQVIDLSQFTTDIYVDGATWTPATATLVLTDNDGTTPDVTIDLSSLMGVSVDAGNLLRDNTSDGLAIFTKADLDAQTNICTSVFGTQLFRGITI